MSFDDPSWIQPIEMTFDEGKPIRSEQGLMLAGNPIACAFGKDNAPIVFSGFHPFDSRFVGDGATGEIYNFDTDGTVSYVETPAFDDGYTYMVRAENVSANSTNTNFTIDLYRESDGFYNTIETIHKTFDLNAKFFFPYPRIPNKFHGVHFVIGTQSIPPGTSYQATLPSNDKITKARLRWSGGNIDGGKFYLYRQREYISG